MLAIHPFITFSRLSERDNGVKYNNTGLEDHREPFTDDIEGVEVVENSVCKYFRRASKME